MRGLFRITSYNVCYTKLLRGGLEIATIAGGMLEAAARKMVIITDGFITTSALLVAHAIEPRMVDYAFFSHQSQEQGHKRMVDFLKGERNNFV